MMKRIWRLIVIPVLLICSLSGWTQSIDPINTIIYEVPDLSEKIDTNGLLDEQAWSEACRIGEFYNPEKAGPPRINAEIQLPIHQLSNLDVEGEFWGFNISWSGIDNKEVFHSTPMGLRSADAANFRSGIYLGAS